MNVSTNSLIDFELTCVNLNDNDMAHSGYPDEIEELRRGADARGTAAADINSVTVVMADAAALVPSAFSGTSGTDADSWMRRFANYCQYRRLEGDDRLPLFRLLLTDAAADWMQSLPEEMCDDFEEVQAAFRKRFITDAASKSVNVAALWNRKQRHDESAEDFINSTRRLATRIPVEDEALVCHAAIQGLREDTRRFVMLRGAETLDQVMTAARLAEATAIQTTTSGDKAVLRELDDLKRMFSRLIEASTSNKTTVDVNSLTANMATSAAQPSSVATATPAFSVQYVVPTSQQVQGPAGRGNFRGRGRGLRRRGWGPRWNPYSGPPVMSTPYGYVQPYAAPYGPYAQAAPPEQTFSNTMRQPFQMSAATQPFQPQVTTPPVTAQTNQATTTNSVVCSRCGRYHDHNSCPASVALCYRCGLTGHFARCCNVMLPQ